MLNELPEPSPHTDVDVEAEFHDAMSTRIEAAYLEGRLEVSEGAAADGLVKTIVRQHAKIRLLLWRCFPVNKLPVEILVYILRFAVTSFATNVEVSYMRESLLRVCSTWRRLMLDTPSMWRRIEFSKKIKFNESLRALQHSKTLPVYITIDHRDPTWTQVEHDDHYFGVEHMEAIMGAIASNMRRVRELCIRVDTWRVALVALTSLSCAPRAEILRAFEIHRSGPRYVRFSGEAPQLLKTPIPIFRSGAPVVECIRFSGVHVKWEEFSLQNLQVLEFRRMALEVMPSLQDFHQMLAANITLRKLVFDGTGPKLVDIEATKLAQPVKLPLLRDLLFNDVSTEYATLALRTFEAPNLRRFALHTHGDNGSPKLFELLPGKFPRVNVVVMDHLNFAPTEASKDLICSWLRSMPNLRYLKVSLMSPVLAAALTTRLNDDKAEAEGSDSVICPQLRTIDVDEIDVKTIRILFNRRPMEMMFISEARVRSFSQAEFSQVLTYMRAGKMKVIALNRPVRPEQSEVYITD
jgi:hypothetical protein